MPEKLTSVSHCKSKQCWRLSNSVQGITAVLCSHSSDTQCSTAFRLLRRNSVPLVLTGCYKLLWCLAGQSPGGYLVSPLSVKCIAMHFLANTELKGKSESVKSCWMSKAYLYASVYLCCPVSKTAYFAFNQIQRTRGFRVTLRWHWAWFLFLWKWHMIWLFFLHHFRLHSKVTYLQRVLEPWQVSSFQF